MTTETAIRLEDEIRKECQARFPSIDSAWAVKRCMQQIHENSKKNAEVLMCMLPELVRSQRIKKEDA